MKLMAAVFAALTLVSTTVVQGQHTPTGRKSKPMQTNNDITMIAPGLESEIDNFRDNWWCEPLKEGGGRIRADRDPSVPTPAFFSVTEVAQLKEEIAKLADVAVAPNILAAEVLGYAKLHADDERVPEALHLVVRSTRYGCTDAETTKWSEKAFRLLHERYPKSEWATKTKYHY